MAAITPEPQGFDYEFVDEVSEGYKCIICHLPMKNPVQTSSCGHLFCKDCLEKWFKRKPNCPMCQTILTAQQIFPDKNTERQILSLKIKCPHQGCDWQGQLRHIEDHEKHCDYKVVDCDNEHCNVKKPRRDMGKHVQEECEYRMVSCPHCNDFLVFLSKLAHVNECPKWPVNCPNGCGIPTIERERIKTHLSCDCALTSVPCSYQFIGCTDKVQRKDLDDHNKDYMEQHLTFAVDKIVLQQKQIDEHEKQIKSLKKALERTQTQLVSIKEQIPITMEDSVKEIPPNSPIMIQEGDSLSYLWKISNYFKSSKRWHVSNAQSTVKSDPFYTHERGYKLRMELIHTCHDFSDNHSLICLSVKIMKGEYDKDLKPAFCRKAKIILFDPRSLNRFLLQNIVKTFDGKQVYNQMAASDEVLPVFYFHEKYDNQPYFVLNNTVHIKLTIQLSSENSN